MVNTLEEQQLENELLISEKKYLEKQLAEKEEKLQQFEENLKFRIFKTVHTIAKNPGSGGLLLLEKFTWPEKGWISSNSGSFDSLDRYLSVFGDERVAKKCVVFSKDFNLENVIKDFDQELRSKDESLEISFNGYQFLENQLKEEIVDLKKKIEESKAELEEKDDRIEELEERVDIEVEMNLKALDKSAEWREKQLKEVKSAHVLREKWFLKQIEVLENNIDWLKNKEQIIKKYEDRELPALPKKQKQSRLLKFKKLVNKVKEKSKEKFQTHVLEKFEAHILQPK